VSASLVDVFIMRDNLHIIMILGVSHVYLFEQCCLDPVNRVNKGQSMID
jgi:hypothetical protein